jgi:hypothetical protein
MGKDRSMKQPLFDVIITVLGDTETRDVSYDVSVLRLYTTREHIGVLDDAQRLEDALEFARGAVTAFLGETHV